MWLCLPVCLHTCAHTLNTYLYLPEYTPVHSYSLPPTCTCSLVHPSTGVIAHTGFVHMPQSLSCGRHQNRYVCGARQLVGPPAQGRASEAVTPGLPDQHAILWWG